MKKSKIKDGTCKLTLKSGRFVDSHLIPKALTKLEIPGTPLIQGGRGHYPTKRWSSWYDSALVIREGEDILARLDSWAIREFRKRKLLWSGWGPALKVTENHSLIPGTDWGMRTITDLDPAKARLFFASLLWRAAATDLPEFSEITMPEDDLEALRKMLVNDDPGAIEFYPTSLTQIHTLGEIHNQTPISQVKIIPEFDGVPEQKIPIFRFYFDGLIVHITRQSTDKYGTKELGPLIVGQDNNITISTVSYETSFQRENLQLVKEDSFLAALEQFGKTNNPAFLKYVL